MEVITLISDKYIDSNSLKSILDNELKIPLIGWIDNNGDTNPIDKKETFDSLYEQHISEKGFTLNLSHCSREFYLILYYFKGFFEMSFNLSSLDDEQRPSIRNKIKDLFESKNFIFLVNDHKDFIDWIDELERVIQV